MSRWKLLKRLLPLSAVMMLFLTGCGKEGLSALNPKGPVAQEQFFLMALSTAIMLFVFVVVMAIYIYVLIRYRKRKGQTDIPKQVEGNFILEVVWTIIPIVLLIILAVPTLTITFKQAKDYRDHEDAIHVKVTGHQYWWQFEYPDLEIVTAQELVIPVGKYIAVEVTSQDVIHSFWVPALAGKIDANAGLTNLFYIKADEAMLYQGRCAEFCGDSHTLMDFEVRAVSEADFHAWTTRMKTPAAAVPADVVQGQQVFKDNCLTCHAVESTNLSIGPNLKGFANREKIAGFIEHNDENLKKWVDNPESFKPGVKMPAMGLSDQQLNDVIKYMNTLK